LVQLAVGIRAEGIAGRAFPSNPAPTTHAEASYDSFNTVKITQKPRA
jgi:hypothetical protein